MAEKYISCTFTTADDGTTRAELLTDPPRYYQNPAMSDNDVRYAIAWCRRNGVTVIDDRVSARVVAERQLYEIREE